VLMEGGNIANMTIQQIKDALTQVSGTGKLA
jgi:hypothetical protein